MIGNAVCNPECNRAQPVNEVSKKKVPVGPCQSYDLGDCSLSMLSHISEGLKLARTDTSDTAAAAATSFEAAMAVWESSDIQQVPINQAGNQTCAQQVATERQRQTNLYETAQHMLNSSVSTSPQPLQVVEGASGWQEWQPVFQAQLRTMSTLNTNQEFLIGYQTTIKAGQGVAAAVAAAEKALSSQMASFRKGMTERFDKVDKAMAQQLELLKQIRQSQLDAAAGITDADKQFQQLQAKWDRARAHADAETWRAYNAQTRFGTVNGSVNNQSRAWDQDGNGAVEAPEAMNMIQDIGVTQNEGVGLFHLYQKLWIANSGVVTRQQIEDAASSGPSAPRAASRRLGAPTAPTPTIPDLFSWGNINRPDRVDPAQFIRQFSVPENADLNLVADLSDIDDLITELLPAGASSKWVEVMDKVKRSLQTFLSDDASPHLTTMYNVMRDINDVKAACAIFRDIYSQASKAKDVCMKAIGDLGDAAKDAMSGNFFGAFCNVAKGVADGADCLNRILKIVKEVLELTKLVDQIGHNILHDGQAVVDNMATVVNKVYNLFPHDAPARSKLWSCVEVDNTVALSAHLDTLGAIGASIAPLSHSPVVNITANMTDAYSQINSTSLSLVQSHLGNLATGTECGQFAAIGIGHQRALASVLRASSIGSSARRISTYSKLVAYTQAHGRFQCSAPPGVDPSAVCLWGTNSSTTPTVDATTLALKDLGLSLELNRIEALSLATDVISVLHKMDAKFRFQTLSQPGDQCQVMYGNLQTAIDGIGAAITIKDINDQMLAANVALKFAWAASVDCVAFPPLQAWFGYTLTRDTHPDFFSAIETGGNASLNIPLLPTTTFTEARAINMDVSAYFLRPSTASSWPAQVTTSVAKGPMSAFRLPDALDPAQGVSTHWVHPNINGGHSGRTRAYAGSTCHNTDTIVPDGNTYLFPSPYGLWSVSTSLPAGYVAKTQAVRLVFKVQYGRLRPDPSQINAQWSDYGDLMDMGEPEPRKDKWACTNNITYTCDSATSQCTVNVGSASVGNSSKTECQSTCAPEPDKATNLPRWVILTCVSGAVILIGITIVVVWRRRKNRAASLAQVESSESAMEMPDVRQGIYEDSLLTSEEQGRLVLEFGDRVRHMTRGRGATSDAAGECE